MGWRIAQIAAEVTPFAKTGGLGDVVTGLSRALGRKGHDVRIFLPFYQRIAKLDFPFVAVAYLRDLEMQLGERRFIWSVFTTRLPDSEVDVYFAHCPALYHHEGVYSGDWDEYLRVLPKMWTEAWTTAFMRGGLRKCPRCGEGAMFRGYLSIAEQCSNCALPIEPLRADDAPAYFTIAIVGHIVW